MPNNVRNSKKAAHPATSIVTQQQQRHQQTTSSTGKDSSIPIPDMNFSDITKSPEYGNPNIQMLALNQQSQPVYMPSQQNYLPLPAPMQQTTATPPSWVQSIYELISNLSASTTEQISKLSATTNEIFKRTERLENIEQKINMIDQSLEKLNLGLKSANERIDKIEGSCQFLSNGFDEINDERNSVKKLVECLEKNMQISQEDISKNLRETQDENDRLHNELLYLQVRSMRFNLLFYGVVDRGPAENTEQVLNTFLEQELNITNAPIQVTHRLGPYRESQTRPRTIVAHFVNIGDKERIKKAAKMLAGKPYSLNDQFPQEIANRRKQLYPIFKQARRNNKKAVLKVDRLYIEGREYIPNHPDNNYRMQRPLPPAPPQQPAPTRPAVSSNPPTITRPSAPDQQNQEQPRKRGRHSTGPQTAVTNTNRFAGMPTDVDS